jgi:hypothetical protein
MNKPPLFSTPIINSETQDELTNDLFIFYQKIFDAKDDRSYVLLVALVFENILDGLLKSFLPRYSKETLKNAYSKIVVLELLHFVANKHIEFCKLVFNIRNKFAHNIHIERIEDLPQHLLADIVKYQKEHIPYLDSEAISNNFREIVSWEVMSLIQQEASLRVLRNKIESDSFLEELKDEFDERDKYGSFEVKGSKES